jgi:signal transduction histidine kinase/ActR/RegA family two-component response regulator
METKGKSNESDIFQQILDRSTSLIYISDRHTHEMLYANKPARQLNGGGDEDYSGRKCYEYIRGEKCPCSWCFLDRVKPGELYQEKRYFPKSDTYNQISGEYITWHGRDAFVQYVDDITRTQKLQNNLQESRRMYRLAVEGAELGVWKYDIAANTVTCPAIYCARYPLPAEFENVPESVLGYFVPEDRPKVREMFEEIDAGRQTVTKELWLNMGQGMPLICCKVTFSTVTDDEGKPVKAYGVSQNITAQKAESRKYERSLGELLALNPQALCTFRLNLTSNRCGGEHGNSTYIQQLLRADTADELFNNIASIITDPEDAKNFAVQFNRERFLRDFAAGITHVSLSYHRKVDSGETHLVTTYLNMLQNPDTGDIEAVAYSVDKEWEQKEEEIISAVTNREYDYIALINVKTRRIEYQYTSPQAVSTVYLRMADFDESMSGAFTALMYPEDLNDGLAAVALDHIEAVLKTEKEYSYSFRCRGRGGSSMYKQLSFRFLNDKNSEILFTRTDITEAFAQEQERTEKLRLAMLEAKHASEMKTEFLSNVSHDMRTPLNAVLGYTRLALKSGDAADVRDYLQKIEKAGNILLSLINDTLDLSKIETGAVTLKPEPVPCGEIIQKVVASVKPAMDEKHIQFTLENSSAVMATINADALRLQEIFINLLSNAVKFTPEGGKVALVVECVGLEKNCVHDRITVRDTGCGMSEDFLPKIFEPFTQERTPATAGIQGSGLGLTIVRRLVELMHGTIDVKSTMGKGTEITVCLDFERVDDSQGVHDADGTGAKDLRGLNVLLCEDNPMNTEIAKKLLEMRGVSVTCAENGRAGLELFTSSRPGTFDTILMDIRMPEMDGNEAARRIRASDHPDAERVAIIAMSADAYDDDVKRSAEAGMNGHIAKPIDPQKMYAALRRLT